MSTVEEDGKKKVDNPDQKTTLSCSMTFQNAIEIDFSKLREMAKQEALEKEKLETEGAEKETEKESEKELDVDVEGEGEEGTESLSAPVLNTSSQAAPRDLSMYDRPLESHDPDSSSDDEEENEGARIVSPEDEPETEVENSDDNSEEGGAQYEQLGGAEFTTEHSDDEGADDGDADGANSDGEFGEFESCPVSAQTMSASSDTEVRLADAPSGAAGEDRTQDVLWNYHPRTAASAIPPLDQAKIDLIKTTMAALTLKPLGNAARVADAVIRAKPRVGDELKHAKS